MIKQCIDAKIAPLEKYKTIYSGMELEDFVNSKPDSELRRKLNTPEKVQVIVTVARLFELKGYEYLIPAAEKITEKFPDAHFLIVGDGILMDDVKQQAKEKNLNFVFAGLVPPSEVYRYIALSDFLIHLSLSEGLPRAVVRHSLQENRQLDWIWMEHRKSLSMKKQASLQNRKTVKKLQILQFGSLKTKIQKKRQGNQDRIW